MIPNNLGDIPGFFSLSEQEKSFLPTIKQATSQAPFIEALVEYLSSVEATNYLLKQFVNDDQKLVDLKSRIYRHFEFLFTDPFSKDFNDSTQKVGRLHAEIGVRPDYILLATCFLQSFFVDHFSSQFKDHPEKCLLVKILAKLLLYNAALLLQGYFDLGNKDLERVISELASLNRMHVLLREINFLIYEERTSPERLFQRACEILHKMGNFALVWVGIEEDEGEDLRIIAAVGKTEYLKKLKISRKQYNSIWKNYLHELLQGHPLMIKDLSEEAERVPSLKRACKYFKSLIVLPLFLESKLKGVLCLYHDRPCTLFDKSSLLIEVAKDLSLGWTHIEKSTKLERLLFTDDLTGLGNERYFLKALERELEIARRRGTILALFRIDLDDFSLINHSLGYLAGNEILKEIAKRLLSLDSLLGTIARTGPDDFAISCHLEREDELHEVLLTIHKKLEQPFIFQEQVIKLSTSIGVALFPKDAQDPKALFEAATVALKKAQKEASGGLAFYTEKETKEIFHRFRLLEELEKALEQQEFVLFFQPRIRLVDRKICGFEALIRWRHPQKGLIPPGEFISVLEESGLIVKVGRWVMQESARFLKELNTRYPDIIVSFNLSVRQFGDKGLVQTLEDCVRQTGINPANFQIEITERVLLETKAAATQVLRDIKDLGLKIGIDDFGTGFSSLVYLKRIPAESLKVDYSFVRGLPDNREDVEIVKAIVGMAKNLDKETIAEGVESREQLAFLTGLGVDEVQGFYFARPMPKEEVFSFLETFTPEEYFWRSKRRS